MEYVKLLAQRLVEFCSETIFCFFTFRLFFGAATLYAIYKKYTPPL